LTCTKTSESILFVGRLAVRSKNMDDNAFEHKCRGAINALVDTAKRVAGQDSVRSALQHVVRLEQSSMQDAKPAQFDYYLGIDTLHNLTNLFTYIEWAQTKHLRNLEHIVVMLKLFSYVQCVENRYTYKAVGNLLQVMQKKSPDGELYDSFSSGAQCFNAICELAGQVLEATTLLQLWREFIDFPLRNAISHGDYVIRKDLQVVFIPSATLDHIAGTNKRRTSQVRYSFKDIDKLYRKANGFQAAFKAQVQEFGIAIGPRY
jgi:hypothetical protein